MGDKGFPLYMPKYVMERWMVRRPERPTMLRYLILPATLLVALLPVIAEAADTFRTVAASLGI